MYVRLLSPLPTFLSLPSHITHTERTCNFRAVGWLLGRQGLFLTMLLDVVPNAVSHLRCESLLSHHLALYFFPGHLGTEAAMDPRAPPPPQNKCGPSSWDSLGAEAALQPTS